MRMAISLAAFVLLVSRLAAAQSPAPAFAIAGTVIDAATGNPVPRAQLTLNFKNDEAAGVADAGGRFLFDHLEAGKYQLFAGAPGYTPQGLDQHGSFFTGVVVGNGLDSRHIVFRLHPQAVVFGRITDDRGAAVRNASVWVVSQTRASDSSQRPFTSQSQTDDLGEYRLAGLPPGDYAVAVSAQPWYAQTVFRYVPDQTGDAQSQFTGALRPRAAKFDSALDVVYPLTFYPGVTDERSATALHLREGETQQADVPLRAVPSVHLRLTNLPPDQAASPRIALMQPVFGAASIGVPLQYAQISPGEFEVAGVPPGDMIFSLFPQDGAWRNAQRLEVNASGEATNRRFENLAGRFAFRPRGCPGSRRGPRNRFPEAASGGSKCWYFYQDGRHFFASRPSSWQLRSLRYSE